VQLVSHWSAGCRLHSKAVSTSQRSRRRRDGGCAVAACFGEDRNTLLFYDPMMRLRPLAVLGLAALAACCEFSGPRWHGHKSDHFDGEKFHNQIPGVAPDFATVVRWRMVRRPGGWPAFARVAPAAAPPQRVA